MERHEILEMMGEIKLSGMRAAYDEIVTQASAKMTSTSQGRKKRIDGLRRRRQAKNSGEVDAGGILRRAD